MLFSSVNEIKTILPIGAGNDFNRLKPHIENAENRYIKPLLGVPMYEELQEFYETEYPQEPTEVQVLTKTLLEKVQFATIHLACFTGFDFLNTTVTDAGFQRIETERTKGLYKYQEDAIKVFFSESGFNALDDVLVFLEENIESFHEFKNHENYSIYKKAFLPSVKVVENIPFNIHGSRLIFLALQPAIAYIEDASIRPVLGEEIYAEIKTGMQNDDPEAKVKAILPLIRKPLIYLASAMLMEETGATLYEKGLFFEENNDQQRSQKTKGPSSEERIVKLVNRNRNIGNNYLEMLKSHLMANWENYSGQTGPVYTRDNTGKRTFFA